MNSDIFRRDELLDIITNKILHFDAELRCLRHNKFNLDIYMKNADLRFICIFLV